MSSIRASLVEAGAKVRIITGRASGKEVFFRGFPKKKGKGLVFRTVTEEGRAGGSERGEGRDTIYILRAGARVHYIIGAGKGERGCGQAKNRMRATRREDAYEGGKPRERVGKGARKGGKSFPLFFRRAAVFADKILQFAGTFLGRNASKVGEHDGFVNFQKRKFLADVAAKQQFYLLVHQQINDGKIDVVSKNALFHSLLEKTDGLYRIVFFVTLVKLIDLWIFLQVFKETFVGGMKAFDAAQIKFEQHVEHMVRRFQQASHVSVHIVSVLQDTSLKQHLLVGKHFVKGTLGNAQ